MVNGVRIEHGMLFVMRMKAFWIVLDAVFPHRCADCGTAGAVLCAPCHKRLAPARSAGVSNPPAFALYDYRDPAVRRIVYALKYRRAREAAFVLARDMMVYAHRIAERKTRAPCKIPHGGCDSVAISQGKRMLVVPVPPHILRRLSRGWSQTHRLAHALAACDARAFEYAPRALSRIRNTPPQTDRPHEKRRKNVRGCFAAPDTRAIRGRDILLVDDVITTGATVREAARALKRAGARSVFVAAIAH